MEIYDFMKKSGMTAADSQIPGYARLFAEDLTNALEGREADLQPLRSLLSVPEPPRSTDNILAVDFGGTNIRLAEFSFGPEGEPLIENFTQEKIESGTLDKDYFFGWLADRLEPYDIENVGFVFSYQAESMPDGDARIVGLSKGLSVPGAIGLILGQEINKVLVSRGKKPRKYTVINDTVAVFLAAAAKLEDPQSLAAAVIAGTGSNCCCVYNGEIINIEWELFDEFPKGTFDVILDRESNNPGEHLTGKLVGGKYLAQLVDMCFKGAAAEGVKGLPMPGASYVDEKAVQDAVYESIYHRAAVFIVGMLRGVVEISPAAAAAKAAIEAGGAKEDHPVWICMEGGTYDHAPGYKECINGLIDEYISKPLGLDCRIMQVQDAGITGAAIAALHK